MVALLLTDRKQRGDRQVENRSDFENDLPNFQWAYGCAIAGLSGFTGGGEPDVCIVTVLVQVSRQVST